MDRELQQTDSLTTKSPRIPSTYLINQTATKWLWTWDHWTGNTVHTEHYRITL